MTIRVPKKLVYILMTLFSFVAAFAIGSRFNRPVSTQKSTPPAVDVLGASGGGQAGQVREIAVTARQFEFSPNTVRVRLGENIRLRITSADVTHGFSLPEFGINETLVPGQTATVEFQATKKGEFPFVCSIVCGSGHTGMRGTLIIE